MNIRHDAKAAAEVLTALMPDARQRRAVAETLAASIRFAHRQAPAAWELTGWRTRVRLNVGQIAVFDVDANEMRIYAVRGSSLRSHGYRLTGYGDYAAVEVPSECWCVPIAAAKSVAKPLLERHRALVRAAAQAKRVSPFKRSHSPGFVEAIARLAGGTLPRPRYEVPRAELADEPTDIEAAERACFGSPESKRMIERAAIEFVTSHLESEDWRVRSVERDRCGYDLHCRRGNEECHVEVKGVAGAPDRFIITAGEVHRAESDPLFQLMLVGQALSAKQTLGTWAGTDVLRAFKVEPIQYYARRAI